MPAHTGTDLRQRATVAVLALLLSAGAAFADDAEPSPGQGQPEPLPLEAQPAPPAESAPVAEAAPQNADPRPQDDGAVPAVTPFEEYQALIAASPFVPPTPPAEPPPPAPNFSQNLYVAAVAKWGSKDFVTVASRDGSTRYQLFAGEPGPDGILLERVEWNPEIGKSRATVRKGGEVATIEFDQAVARAVTSAPQVPQPNPGMPGMQQPHRQPRFSPPQGGVPQMGMPGGPNPGATPAVRRRVRIVAPPQ